MTQEHTSTAYIVLHKGLVGKRIQLWKDCTTIGRSRDCDIFLEDITVHRKQASIVYTSGGYLLRDDHGSGDSLINGHPVKEQLLNSGDQLLLGNTRLTFFANEGTRPFQLPISRGRELHMNKAPDSLSVAYLDVANPRMLTGRIELSPEMTIGRSRDCNIFLEDLAVSRLHATIRELPNGDYELVDNRSATGTFVNGHAMTHCVLHESDIVQIGLSTFTFHLSRSRAE